MPVFTAAVVSVLAVTSIATAATAVVAVSAAIGVAGLAVSAVGMITKNKDLLKVGKIMGYVGLAGSLAGGALGGVGGLMEGGKGFLEGASGAFQTAGERIGDVASSYADNISNFFNPQVADGVVSGSGTVTGAGANTGVQMSGQGVNPGLALVEPVTQNMSAAAGQVPSPDLLASQSRGMSGAIPADQMAAAGQSAAANVGPTPGIGTGNETYNALVSGANPGQDPFGVTNPITSGASGGSMGPMDSLKQLLPNGGSPTNAKGLWDSMPDYMKYATVTGGIASLSGVMGGFFNGLSAEEQLNFEKMVNQQRENQVQYQNKNNQYSPLVKFSRPTGFINQVGRA